MEVEAKFVIPDQDTIKRLKNIVRLGSFAFAPKQPERQHVQDRYYDTPDQTLYQSGYACRIRRHGGQRIVTVKGLGHVETAIHQRFESEFVLVDTVDEDGSAGTSVLPQNWPQSEARDLILSRVQDRPLGLLFVIEQERTVRNLEEGDHVIAQLSIDQVTIQAHQQQLFWILEVELTPQGTIDQLRLVSDHLQHIWGLEAEHRSKFDLGMALLAQGEPNSAETWDKLSSAERAQLGYIARQATDSRLQDRAQLILELVNNVPVRKLAAQIGRSRSWAYGWIARFRTNRMGIFPSPVLERAQDLSEDDSLETTSFTSTSELADEPLPSQEGISVSDMCSRFQVDIDHAQCVANHALALFDALAPIHRLDADRRELLRVMGMLHNVGLESDPIQHHIAGRNIILAHRLLELSQVEQHMLAAAVYLHRKKIKSRRLESQTIATLPPGVREDTLALAALVRIADGLDYSQSQTTTLELVRTRPSSVDVVISGPYAQTDAARAESKADLWEHTFGIPVVFLTEQTAPVPLGSMAIIEQASTAQAPALPEAETPQREPVLLRLEEPVSTEQQSLEHEPVPWLAQEPVSAGILPDESMSEAGRQVLYLHFRRMIKNQASTRQGKDLEALHDMRVATRRMRSAFRLFSPYLKTDAIRPHIADLRRTARILGQVRDLDVLMEKARRYLEMLPPENAHDLDPLLQTWAKQREQARAKMIDHLDGTDYQDFVEAFGRFLTTPGAGSRKMKGFPPKPYRVRHVAPRLIYSCWERVQAFDTTLENAPISAFHALRIQCKRLRYTLEFFSEVLGKEAADVIAHVTQLQDHLGNLNDANVANTILSDFLFSRQDAPGEPVIAPGIVAYLAFKQRELQHLLEAFPQAWQEFNQPKVRRSLAYAIAAL